MGLVRRSAAIVASSVLLMLAACGGENPAARPSSSEEPTLSVASEPSDGGGKGDSGGEPTETVPDIPPPDPKDFPGMDQKTDEGAEQAARYFFHVLYWAHQTDGVAEYDQLVFRGCKGCKRARAVITARTEAKSFWSKTEVKVDSCDLKYSDEDTREYHCRMAFSAHFEPAYPGEPAEEVDQTVIATGAHLKWRNGKWMALGFAIAA